MLPYSRKPEADLLEDGSGPMRGVLGGGVPTRTTKISFVVDPTNWTEKGADWPLPRKSRPSHPRAQVACQIQQGTKFLEMLNRYHGMTTAENVLVGELLPDLLGMVSTLIHTFSFLCFCCA
jgi:hypothetical protein